ncbi:MAG TPA: hypothetical protein DEP23_05255 [Ruminococcaceae bacterium]|jgi:hypothetical protein|nr:hypothetical protein [Oscillospiraceae bacterium]
MILAICIIAVLCFLLGIQRRNFSKRIREDYAEIMHLETGIKWNRQNEVLPQAVWDKDGNEYRRLSGEYGNDEFIKCD